LGLPASSVALTLLKSVANQPKIAKLQSNQAKNVKEEGSRGSWRSVCKNVLNGHLSFSAYGVRGMTVFQAGLAGIQLIT